MVRRCRWGWGASGCNWGYRLFVRGVWDKWGRGTGFASGLLLGAVFVSTSGSYGSRVRIRTRVGVVRVGIFNEIEEVSVVFLKEVIKVIENRVSTVRELVVGEDKERGKSRGNGIR